MADRRTVQGRIDAIKAMLLQFEPNCEICRKMSAKWKVDERTIQRYIKSALETLPTETTIKEDFPKHLRQRHQLYLACLNAGQFKTAHQILQDLDTLAGQYRNTGSGGVQCADFDFTGVDDEG